MIEEATDLLIDWYKKEKRDLPWRSDPVPYRVWISEIMLQQTRVEAVKGYYSRFLAALPDIRALASCPEDQLLKLWQGLGYYNRVRNMQKAALVMAERYGGEFPKTYEEVLSLPGIGSYTAGAVCSIAYGLRVPAVDGNVLRVFSRLNMDGRDIALAKTKKAVEEKIRVLIPESAPGTYNQALMELGATVCVPNGAPRCECCPVKEVCEARKKSCQEDFPVKTKKAGRRGEQYTVLAVHKEEEVLLVKRPDTGLLSGLYALPQPAGHLSKKEVIGWLEENRIRGLVAETKKTAKHVFSHVEWQMKGYDIFVLNWDKEHLKEKGYYIVTLEELKRDYPVPSAYSYFYPLLFAGQRKNVGKNPETSL